MASLSPVHCKKLMKEPNINDDMSLFLLWLHIGTFLQLIPQIVQPVDEVSGLPTRRGALVLNLFGEPPEVVKGGRQREADPCKQCAHTLTEADPDHQIQYFFCGFGSPLTNICMAFP